MKLILETLDVLWHISLKIHDFQLLTTQGRLFLTAVPSGYSEPIPALCDSCCTLSPTVPSLMQQTLIPPTALSHASQTPSWADTGQNESCLTGHKQIPLPAGTLHTQMRIFRTMITFQRVSGCLSAVQDYKRAHPC